MAAKRCAYCGYELPKDDARFCSHCGRSLNVTPEQSAGETAQETEAAHPEVPPAIPPQQAEQGGIKEQIAFQPAGKAGKTSSEERPPDWLSSLDTPRRRNLDTTSNRVETSGSADQEVKEQRNEFPAPVAHKEVKEQRNEFPAPVAHKEVKEQRNEFPESKTPRRELPQEPGIQSNRPRVTMPSPDAVRWPAPLTHVAGIEPGQPEQSAAANFKEAKREPIPPPVLPSFPPGQARPELHVKVWNEHGIEEYDTIESAQVLPPGRTSEQTPPTDSPMNQVAAHPAAALPPQQPARPENQQPAQLASSVPSVDHARPVAAMNSQGPVSQGGVPSSLPPQPPMRRDASAIPLFAQRRGLLLILLACVVVVIIIAGGGLLLLTQFAKVPAETQPWQRFSDTGLGFRVQYPSGWNSQVDKKAGRVQFHDNSSTGQFIVMVADGQQGDPLQYLQQQATKQGMTGGKAGPELTFGGATWQQWQGTVVINGASYSEHLLVTMHNQRTVLVMQLAPATVYPQYDQVTFAPMRTSWQFL